MQVLLVRAGAVVCSLPLSFVVEAFRALPVQPIAGAPAFVRGLAVIRGAPLPVVDLAGLLGVPGGGGARFVTLRTGERRVALAVDAVLGVRALDAATVAELPPLVRAASREAIEAAGALDGELLLVLRAAHVVPDEVWRLAAGERTPA